MGTDRDTGDRPAGLSDEEQARRRAAIADLFPSTPFMGLLGITFDRYEPDDVVVRLPFDERWTNDGVVFHGGVIATMLDTAGAAAAWSNHDFDRGTRASTVSMSVQYLAAAQSSDLVVSAHTVRRGRELIFTEITARDEHGADVAHALQTYRIV
ncbi:MAG: PaaI family thioesterase [Actinomycetota bacterium]